MLPTTDYTVVFDIVDAGYKSWRFPAFGLIFLAIGVVLVLARRWPVTRILLRQDGRWGAVFTWLWLGFAVLWTVSTFIGTYMGYRSLKADYEAGRAEVVTGELRDFRPLPISEKGTESFTVSGIAFEYSSSRVTAGFNTPAARGGLLREGQQVRIHHIGNTILRLEIASQQLPATSEVAARVADHRLAQDRMIHDNPTARQFGPGMAFGMLVVSAMWNIRWRHSMRYWLKSGPPYGRGWELGFRIFFAVLFLGTCFQALGVIHDPAMTGEDYLRAGGVAVGIIVIFVVVDLIHSWRSNWRKPPASPKS